MSNKDTITEPKPEAKEPKAGKFSLSAAEMIRLECVKLAYRMDHEPPRILRTAAALEHFVLTGEQLTPGEDGGEA